jgi:hypothetical protein
LQLLVLQHIGDFHGRVLGVIEFAPSPLALLGQPVVEFIETLPAPVFGQRLKMLVRLSRTFFSTIPFSQPLAGEQNSGSKR